MKNFRLNSRILSCVLAIVMILGTCTTAFAAGVGGTDTPSPIKYVSLGDSMTNGYGLEGYEPIHNGEYVNVNGFLQNVEGSYPMLFKEELEEMYGTDVELIQLATSATRADDTLYLLKYGTENEVEADDYTQGNVPSRFNEYYNCFTDITGNEAVLEDLANTYQTAVEEADVISVGVGSNNFSTFLTRRIGYYVGAMAPSFGTMFGSMYDITNLPGLLENVDPQLAEDAIEIYEEVEILLAEKFADMGWDLDYELGVHPAGSPLGGEILTVGGVVSGMAETVAYTAAGFMISYKGIIDHIIEVNPDAKIIVVGLSNWLNGMNVELADGLIIPVGEILDVVYGAVNAYMAALPASYDGLAQLKGEDFPDIYFAEVGDVELLSEQMADTAEIPTVMTRRRMVRDVVGSILPMMGDALGAFPAMIDVDDVEEYEATALYDGSYGAFNQYLYEKYGLTSPDAFTPYYISCVGYLGIEKAFLNTVDLQNFPIGTFLALATEGGLQSVVMEAMASIDIEAGVTPDNIYDALVSTPELQGLCNIFAIYVAGDGVLCHPSTEGHQQVSDAMVYAVENEITATDVTLGNLHILLEEIKGYINEYYDEAYAYAYAEADQKGYIDAAAKAIDDAINVIYNLDLDNVEATDEFKALLADELGDVVITLNEIKTILAEDKASDVDGLYNSVMALKDDLYDHLATAGAILMQAEYDIKTLVAPVVDAYVRGLIDAYWEEFKALIPEEVAKLGHKPYTANNDSYYVAIGGDTVAGTGISRREKGYYDLIQDAYEIDGSTIADEMLYAALTGELIEENKGQIENADLITYQLDASSFIYATLLGTPDWDNYLDAEEQALIAEILEQTEKVITTNWVDYANAKLEEILPVIKAEVLKNIPEDIWFADYIFDTVADILVPYLMEAVSYAEEKKDEVVSKIPTLDAMVLDYAEKLAYAVVSYAVETKAAIEAIQEINPDATLVVVGMYNPARGLEIVAGGETFNAEEIFEYAIDATNLYYSILSAENGGFAFVDVSDAETNGFGTEIDVTALQMNEIAAILLNAGGSMHANAAGHEYIKDQIIDALTCDFSVYEEYNKTYHYVVCALCGDKYTEEHNFSGKICTDCGYEKSSTGLTGVGGGGAGSSQLTVKFDTNGGSVVESVVLSKGDLLAEPAAPTKSGYIFGGWYVDKALTSKYDFSTPVTKSFTLYAKWIGTGAAEKFTDINTDDWHYEYVQAVVENGHMNGISDTLFAPDATLTRGMFVTILYRVEGEPAAEDGIAFTDVAAGQYYENAVKWASANGIVKGITETEFAPDAEVTREQMAAMIARYIEYKEIAVPEKEAAVYTDADQIADYAKEAVVIANKLGILIGNTDGSFAPAKNATRAEAATLFVRLVGVLAK